MNLIQKVKIQKTQTQNQKTQKIVKESIVDARNAEMKGSTSLGKRKSLE